MRGQTPALRRQGPQALDRPKHGMRPRAKYNKVEEELAAALSECLDEMQKNGGDIEAALARNPELAAEIRPLLEVAAMLRAART